MNKNNTRWNMRGLLSTVSALCALVCAGVTWAQTIEERRLAPIGALRLEQGESIKLDGKLDDAAWAKAPVIREFHEYRPRQAPAKVRTEARIVYGKDALYVGLMAFDPDPSKIEAPLVRRDQVFGSQDFFALHIDPVGNRKFAQIFRVNAAGAIGDGLFNEDNGNEDFSPDFIFDAQTAITPEGWSAEFRIPFSTIRYADPPSPNWSIFVFRRYPRDEQYSFSNARIPKDANCSMCFAQGVTGMTGLPHGRELTVTPQLTLRQTTDRLNGVEAPRERDVVVGLDVKYRPRPDLVFDATINPDFSQVELDTPQLAANAQFALFYPEKRPFFLEGADILNAPFGGAIYTRSITDPAWGTRVTRRADGHDIVVLTARDDGKGLILLPKALGTDIASQETKSQATIIRARSQQGSVSWGALFNDRTYESATGIEKAHNRVAGVDATWRPTGEMRFRAQVLMSDTDDKPNERAGIPDRDNAALIDYNYVDAHWGLYGGVERVGKGFRNDNGFFGQSDYLNWYQEVNRKFADVGPFSDITVFLHVGRKTGNGGQVLYQQAVPGVRVAAARGTYFGVEARVNPQTRFRADGEPLKRDQFFAFIESAPGGFLSRYFIEAAIGDRGDFANNRVRKGYYIGGNALFRLSDRWEIEPRIDESLMGKEDILSKGADRVIRERALQVTSVYHFTAKDTLRFIGQYNGVRRNLAFFPQGFSPSEKSETVSVVYGHIARLGTNFYVGANSTRSADPSSRFARRQNEIFLKASWAFDLAALGG
jgi:hypothetical protein